jgi:hypothetical protein
VGSELRLISLRFFRKLVKLFTAKSRQLPQTPKSTRGSGLPMAGGQGHHSGMPQLTRCRYPERPDCWHVYYGDVHVGTIAKRTGNPHDTDPWGWRCGFYPRRV